ncbi:hypothetical protein B0H66DRAFT_15304 [Apodospora peruviana]|uniref:protein S-acyltransferase n=1 Tax=Apodospora peruviana TaxID=516989 RepID=A0AAE0IQ63_9PEZI|nr:hypothetical protein B0H66DRAFT_15304 [Apodospora peruviana]
MASSKDIPATGLTTLVNPEEASLDIVFLHGFTGHPEKTWTHKDGDVAKSRSQWKEGGKPGNFFSRLNRKSAERVVFWPRDLLPATIPEARVLTYGYDTHLTHVLGRPLNRTTVYDIAGDFLVALEASRRSEPSRPILFVVHSLGGIVIKEALRQANICRAGKSHLRDAFASTIGIVFFGTPHGGADPRGLPQFVAESLVRMAGFRVNQKILDSLLPSSDRLKELRNEFGPIAAEHKWLIHSFQEELGVSYLNGNKVVEDGSSDLGLESETTEHIGRNHMDMCRFTGPEDFEYRKVAAVLDRIRRVILADTVRPASTDDGVPNPTPTDEEKEGIAALLSPDQRKILLDSLKFEQMDARQMSLKAAHAKTCTWLLETPDFIDWLDWDKIDHHHGLLWIKGNPGTGKSTLMKFVLGHFRKFMIDRTVISFFFNARGTELERSTVGMYRSLLFKLLGRQPELQPHVFDSLGVATWNADLQNGVNWSTELLKEGLEQAVLHLDHTSGVVCVIDALDECDEDEIREMVTFFQQLVEIAVSAGKRFQLLFSSRPYPNISVARGLKLVLERQPGHTNDITTYIQSELRIGNTTFEKEIRAELQLKASGIFIWVVLVVGILNKEHDKGRSARNLQKKLRETPGDLQKLFRDLLTREGHSKEEVVCCLQWVLLARRLLRPEELYHAILSITEPEYISSDVLEVVPDENIRKFILNSSKGLAEPTTSEDPVVQFIHESVKDFLLQGNGLATVWPGLGNNVEASSHGQLARSCVNYLAAKHVKTYLTNFLAEKWDNVRKLERAIPFLHYAAENSLHHAEMAHAGGVSQSGLLQDFPQSQWLECQSLFNLLTPRLGTQRLNVSLLYLFAMQGYSALIRALPSRPSCLTVEEGRYGPPILAALANKNHEAAQTLIELEAQTQPSGSPLHGAPKHYYKTKIRTLAFDQGFKFDRGRGLLSYLAERGDELLVSYLIATSTDDIDLVDMTLRTPLIWAASSGHEEIVKVLLASERVNPDRPDGTGLTPLMWATLNGHTEIVRHLISTGRVNTKWQLQGLSGLAWAARNGHETTFQLLLSEKDVDLNIRDSAGNTALGWAASGGHETMVALLLATGRVNIDPIDAYNRTPLTAAVEYGHERIVSMLLGAGADIDGGETYGKPIMRASGPGLNRTRSMMKLLLDGGADTNTMDQLGQTPLMHAIRNFNYEVVAVLLEHGADPEIKDNAGWTPLAYAAYMGYSDIVRSLLDNGAQPDAKSAYGEWPLRLAICEGNEEVVRLLLDYGADPAVMDYQRRTMVELAMSCDEPSILKLLTARSGANEEIHFKL